MGTGRPYKRDLSNGEREQSTGIRRVRPRSIGLTDFRHLLRLHQAGAFRLHGQATPRRSSRVQFTRHWDFKLVRTAPGSSAYGNRLGFLLIIFVEGTRPCDHRSVHLSQARRHSRLR